MLFFVRILSLLLSVATYSTMLGMTSLPSKTRMLTTTPLIRRIGQTPQTPIQPAHIETLTTTTSPLPGTSDIMQQQKQIGLEKSAWDQVAEKKWAAVKTFFWDQLTNVKNTVQSMLFKSSPISPPAKSMNLQPREQSSITISDAIEASEPFLSDIQLNKLNDPFITKEEAFNSAFNIVHNNYIKLNIATPGINLITCVPIGPELLWLSKINSLNAMEEFFVAKRREILKKIGLSNKEIEDFISTITDNRKNIIKKHYTTPISPSEMIHDQKIPFLGTIKQYLTDAGMNPNTINIVTPSTFAQLFTSYDKRWHKWTDGNKIINAITRLTLPLAIEAFNTTSIASVTGGTTPHEPIIFMIYYQGRRPSFDLTNFVITHEIGHLLRNHPGELSLIDNIIKHQKDNTANNASAPDFDKAYLELLTLYELEADVTVAMINPTIAELAYNELLQKINVPRWKKRILPFVSISSPPTSRPNSPIHSSLDDKFNLMKKIKEFHAKEKTPTTKPPAPDITRE